MADTITFSEKNKGWTGFYQWSPEAICRLNNRLYTIKDGQVYLHNDADNPVRNNFYGVQYNSKVTTVINQNPADDKIFKTLVLESNKPWMASVKTNYTESTIEKEEFEQKESRQFAYLRNSELPSSGMAAYGIGAIISGIGLNITFQQITEQISVGDSLKQLNGSNEETIGVITAINENVITVQSIVTAPVSGYFAFAQKDNRVEGEPVRGYFMEVELENDDTDKVELFAVSSNAIKSYI